MMMMMMMMILLCSFSNLSFTSPTSQFILQHFCWFTYVSQLILQPFRCFTYVTVHSPTFTSLHLRHSSFSNPSVTWPTSQFILQPFFRFSYVTSSPLNSPGEPPTEQELDSLKSEQRQKFRQKHLTYQNAKHINRFAYDVQALSRKTDEWRTSKEEHVFRITYLTDLC